MGSCGICRYWERLTGMKMKDGWGQCKRWPPVVDQVNGAERGLHIPGVFPETHESQSGCGEWRNLVGPIRRSNSL